MRVLGSRPVFRKVERILVGWEAGVRRCLSQEGLQECVGVCVSGRGDGGQGAVLRAQDESV